MDDTAEMFLFSQLLAVVGAVTKKVIGWMWWQEILATLLIIIIIIINYSQG